MLALRLLDLDLAVPGAPRHVIDAAVLGDVALDGATLRCLLLGSGPALLAIDPGRLSVALPDAGACNAGFGFLLHVRLRVLHERPREAFAHHLRIDVAA